jgi:hypothetical protein
MQFGLIESWKTRQTFAHVVRLYFMVASVSFACIDLAGCGNHVRKPPLAPELRGPAKDLTAVRVGDQIWLSWTMPSKRVRNLVDKGNIRVRVCRRDSMTSPCVEAGSPFDVAPSATGSFAEKLPSELSSGTPRVLYYFVEFIGPKGTSTGLSNRVATLAGAPPSPIRGLTAEITERGVLLRWPPDVSPEAPADTMVRLHRNELEHTSTVSAVRSNSPGNSTSSTGEDFLVEGGSRSGQTLDANIKRGSTYEYRAQRVIRMTVDNQIIELPGQLSQAVQIDTGK